MLMLGNLCAKNRLVMSGFYCMDWCFVWSLWSCVDSFIHSFTRHKVIIKYVGTPSSRWHDNQAYNISHNNRKKINGHKEPAYAPVACLTFFTVTIILYILGLSIRLWVCPHLLVSHKFTVLVHLGTERNWSHFEVKRSKLWQDRMWSESGGWVCVDGLLSSSI